MSVGVRLIDGWRWWVYGAANYWPEPSRVGAASWGRFECVCEGGQRKCAEAGEARRFMALPCDRNSGADPKNSRASKRVDAPPGSSICWTNSSGQQQPPLCSLGTSAPTQAPPFPVGSCCAYMHEHRLANHLPVVPSQPQRQRSPQRRHIYNSAAASERWIAAVNPARQVTPTSPHPSDPLRSCTPPGPPIKHQQRHRRVHTVSIAFSSTCTNYWTAGMYPVSNANEQRLA